MNVLTEMVSRDKNHPSVVMWSLANEPISNNFLTEPYFQSLVAFARTVEPFPQFARPLTFVSDADFQGDTWTKYIDVICINRYYGWYSDSGRLDVIPTQ